MLADRRCYIVWCGKEYRLARALAKFNLLLTFCNSYEDTTETGVRYSAAVASIAAATGVTGMGTLDFPNLSTAGKALHIVFMWLGGVPTLVLVPVILKVISDCFNVIFTRSFTYGVTSQIKLRSEKRNCSEVLQLVQFFQFLFSNLHLEYEALIILVVSYCSIHYPLSGIWYACSWDICHI